MVNVCNDIIYLPHFFLNRGLQFIYNLYQTAVLRVMWNPDFNLILLSWNNGKQFTKEILFEIKFWMTNAAINDFLVNRSNLYFVILNFNTIKADLSS